MTGISYNKARQDYLDLFRRLKKSGVREVVFCGVDEVAEVAYLSLKETGLELVAVMDDTHVGEVFVPRGDKNNNIRMSSLTPEVLECQA